MILNLLLWSASLLSVSAVTVCMYPLYYLNTRINTTLYTRPGQCKSNALTFLSSCVTIDAANDVFYLQRFVYHCIAIVCTVYFMFSGRVLFFLLSRLLLLNVNIDHILGHEMFIPSKYRKHGYKYDTMYFLILYVFPLLSLSGVPGSWPNQHTHAPQGEQFCERLANSRVF
jgi:hypothetical protein